MELDNHFTDFLAGIRLTDVQKVDCEAAHTRLRERLEADPDLAPRIVTTFLQGSYRRATVVRPLDQSGRVDVDVVVVTRLHEDNYSPKQVVDLLRPFLNTHYSGWKEHDRSVRLPAVGQSEIDFVVTSSPSQAVLEIAKAAAVSGDWTLADDSDWKLVEGWAPTALRGTMGAEMLAKFRESLSAPELKAEPLRIPSRDLGQWVDTNPLEQIKWTRDKNRATAGRFVNIVKAIKWWRMRNDLPKYPKGYPLEQLVGQVCDNGIGSVAEGIAASFEAIANLGSGRPFVADPGVPGNDVMARVGVEDYAGFWNLARDAARQARAALEAPQVPESALAWRDLLGPEFPVPAGGFTPRIEPSAPVGGRFGRRHG